MTKAEKPGTAQKAEIGDQGGLIRAFERMAQAFHLINAAETIRDKKKTQADQEFEAQTAEPKKVLVQFEDPALQFCIEHRDDLVEEGKKTAIVGPVTIEFRLSPKTLRTQKGKAPDETELVEKLQTEIHKARGAVRQLLENCVQLQPKINKTEIKKLPEDILERLGLKLDQQETVTWKPNAER
jgi:hypothetical protein